MLTDWRPWSLARATDAEQFGSPRPVSVGDLQRTYDLFALRFRKGGEGWQLRLRYAFGQAPKITGSTFCRQ